MEKLPNEIRNFILYPVIFIGHIFYDFGVGHWLFKIAGGIKEYPDGRWTQLGGIDWAFETPLYIPGSYTLSETNVATCAWEGGEWGLLLILIGSLITTISTGQIIQHILDKSVNKFGKYNWRLVAAILGWTFIPVPVTMTLTYSFTVLC